MGVALEFLLNLGNQKPRRSDFYILCKPNNEACRSQYHRMNCSGHKEETCILVSVARLLRLVYSLYYIFALVIQTASQENTLHISTGKKTRIRIKLLRILISTPDFLLFYSMCKYSMGGSRGGIGGSVPPRFSKIWVFAMVKFVEPPLV